MIEGLDLYLVRAQSGDCIPISILMESTVAKE
jgi:hypothetical protein